MACQQRGNAVQPCLVSDGSSRVLEQQHELKVPGWQWRPCRMRRACHAHLGSRLHPLSTHAIVCQLRVVHRANEVAAERLAALTSERDDLLGLLSSTLERLEGVEGVVAAAGATSAVMEGRVSGVHCIALHGGVHGGGLLLRLCAWTGCWPCRGLATGGPNGLASMHWGRRAH